jgi:potassium efflux system protein
MIRSSGLHLIAAVLSLGFAVAQTPEPDRLSADWWLHFTVGEEEEAADVSKRVAEFKTLLTNRLAGIEPAQEAVLRANAERVTAALDRYAALLVVPVPLAVPAPEAQESYTIDEALERHSYLRQAKFDVETLRGEVEWQRALIDKSFQQQKERKVSYLALSASDSTRFDRGLSLMTLRVEMEARALELTAESRTANARQEHVDALETQTAEMPSRVVATDADVEEWKRRVDEAAKAFAEAQQQVLPPSAAVSSPNPVESAAAARRDVLASMVNDLGVVVSELGAARARLGLVLAKVALPASDPDWKAATAQRESFEALKIRANELASQASTASKRIRAAAGGQLSTADASSGFAAILTETIQLSDRSDATVLAARLARDEGDFLSTILSERELASKGWLERNKAKAGNWLKTTWNGLTGVLNYPLFEVNESPVTAFGIIWAIVIIFFALWCSKHIRRAMERYGTSKGGLSKSASYTIQRLIHYVILIIGIMFALSTIGLDLTKVTLFASALGIGLGFGLQNLVSNFVSGLIILFEKTLNVGDFVELQSGVTGEVKEVNMRSTLITTNDNVDILVPNSEFVNGQVTNWTLREAVRRIHVSFGVAYGTEKETVKKAALEAAARVPWTFSGKKREPSVWFVKFGDSSLDFELVVWLTPDAVKRPGAVQSDYLWEIETSLNEHGIEVPFPQRDLHLRSGFAPKADLPIEL